MLKKVKIFTAAVAVLMTVGLTSCGGKKVSSQDLPVSGAKTFITSEEDLKDFIKSIDFDDLEDDGMAYAEVFENVDETKISPNVEEIVKKEAEKATTWAMEQTTGKKGFANTGKAKYAVDLKIGTFKGLPKGLSVKVPTAKADVNFEVGKKGVAKGNANVDVSMSFLADSKKMGIYDSVAVKGVSWSMGLKGNVSATINADEDFDPKEDGYLEYFDSVEGGSVKTDLTLSINGGVSICTSDDVGGKIVVDAVATLKGNYDEEYIEDLAEIFYKLSRGRTLSESDVEKIPFKFNSSVICYNDKGKATYKNNDAISFAELFDILDSLSYYF